MSHKEYEPKHTKRYFPHSTSNSILLVQEQRGYTNVIYKGYNKINKGDISLLKILKGFDFDTQDSGPESAVSRVTAVAVLPV